MHVLMCATGAHEGQSPGTELQMAVSAGYLQEQQEPSLQLPEEIHLQTL